MEANMKAKLLFVVFLFILMLPFAASNSPTANSTGVAYAGHIYGGSAYCTCGCPECVCYPDEVPVACGRAITERSVKDSQPDLSGAALVALLALLFWLRLR
jgi:hypothetical protein